MHTFLYKSYCCLCTLVTLCVFTACSGDIVAPGNPEIVIEGWIENDKNPVVIVTSTIPLSDEFQYIDDLETYAIKSAEVKVSDGEKEVVLKGMANDSYVPSYIYTTSDLVGEIGKNYKLTVDYEQYHAEATTSILNVPCVDSLVVSASETSDTLFQVRAYLRDVEEKTNYYKLFTMIRPKETSYFSYMGSTVRDEILHLHNGISVFPGQKFQDNDYISDFSRADTLVVKIAQIDEQSYRYWLDFEDMFITVSNPIFPIRFNVHSNIHGGKGIWCGYGSLERKICFADK